MKGRVLAIDYGQRRIGLALSDPLGITAQPMEAIERRNNRSLMEELEKLITRWEVKMIVVGLPFNMDGSKGGKALQTTETFIQRLQERFDLPVIAWDERLTTVSAQRTLKEMDQKPKSQKGKVDTIAAQIMLQSYLDSCRTDQEEKG